MIRHRFALREYTVDQDATMLQAAERIKRNKSRAVVVVREGRAIGVVSEGDILRALLNGTDVRVQVQEVMQPGFRYLTGRDLDQAWDLVRRFMITLVPVVDDDFRLVDVITLYDLFETSPNAGGGAS